MTGQKNRFSTTEKLWNLDDKQLKTPKHDAMVLWLMDKNNLYPLLKSKFMDRYVHETYEVNKEKCLYDNEMWSKIESEVPLKSSPTFIAGYADLIVTFEYKNSIDNIKCSIDSELLQSVMEASYVDELENIIAKFKNIKSFELNKSGFPHEQFAKTYFNKEGDSTKYRNHEGYDIVREQLIDDKYPYARDPMNKEDKIYLFLKNSGIDYPKENSISWVLNEYLWHKFDTFIIRCLIEVKPYIDSFGAVLRQIQSYNEFWKYGNSRMTDTYRSANICLFTLDNRFDAQFESQGISILHPPKDFDIQEVMDYYGLS